MKIQKTLKTKMLAILCALCCLAATGFAVTTNTAKADGNFTVSSITYQFREVYNGSSDIRTEFFFKLNADADLLSAYDFGAEITDMTDFGSSVKVNDTAIGSAAGGYKLYKEGKNLLKVVLMRAKGYVSFTLPKDLAIGGYTLAEEVTMYQGVDGDFTTTAPSYNANAIFVRPLYVPGDDIWVSVQVEMTGVEHTGSGVVDNLKINGKALSDYSNTEVRPYKGVAYWDNDYDAGYAGYCFKIYLSKSFLANGLTITIPKDFSPSGTLKTAEERSFYLPAGDYTDWNIYNTLYATYVTNNEFSVSEIKYDKRQAYNELGGQRTEYVFKFNAESDVLAKYADGEEIFLPDFGSKVKVNQTVLNSTVLNGGNNVLGARYKLYKDGVNALRVVLGRPLGYVSFTLPAELSIGGYVLKTGVTYYQEIDGTFTTEEPEYRVNAVYVTPLGDSKTQRVLQIAMTKSAVANTVSLEKVLINGVSLKEATGVDNDYWNDYDAGYLGYHFRYHIDTELLNSGVTITFQRGFSTDGGKYATSEDSTFFIYADDNSNLNALPSFEYGQPISNVLSVESINFSKRETYNSNPGGIRAEYLIKFNAKEDVLAKYTDGKEITDMADFGNKVTVNGTSLSGLIVNGVSEVEPYKLYKESANVLKVVLGRPGWVSFTLPKGLTIGGYTFAKTVTLYQEVDGTFTATDPGFNIGAVYVRPTGETPWVQIQLDRTQAEEQGKFDQASLSKILINGKPMTDYNDSDVRPYAAGKYWDNEYDAGWSGYNFKIYLSYSFMSTGVTITIPKDFSDDGIHFTTEERSFYLPAADYSNFGIYYLCAGKYVNSTAEADVEFFEKTNDGVTYKLLLSVKGDNPADLFAAFNQNDDMTDFVNKTDIPDNVTFNGTALRELSVSYKKCSDNVIYFTVKGDLVPPMITVNSNYVVNNCKVEGLSKIYSSNSDYTLKTGFDEANVINVSSETSFGTMSKDNELRFSIKLDSLGIFAGYANGTNVTSYLSAANFTDNVLINGSTLTQIKANRSISAYIGGRESFVYDQTENSIEIIVSGVQLFDFDVTVKAGCIIGNLEIKEEVTYRKNYNESFDKITEADTEVKPLSIREIPNANLAERCVKIMFNAKVNNNDLINAIKFSNSENDNVVLTATGGKYFNTEDEFGGRMYTIYFATEEYVSFMISEGAKISVGSVKTADGKDTVATDFVMVNGSWVPEGYQGEIAKAEIVKVTQPGNQWDNTKLFMFYSSVSFNHHAFPAFVRDNLYVNGKRVFDYDTAAGYVNSEINYDCKTYAVYISNEIRNFANGFDVICLKAGAPLAGGRTFTEDLYFYAVQDKNQRDGAGNWVWTVSIEKPALELAEKEEFKTVGDNAVITVNFDRIVGKKDALFGVYNENVNVSDYLSINGKTIAEYGDKASYAFTENGIEITVNKAELANAESINVTFKQGFETPLGYSFDKDVTRLYSVKDEVWANSLTVNKNRSESVNVSNVSIETVKVGEKADNSIKVGKKITVKFNGAIAGKATLNGTETPVGLYKNITAPYADLIKLTQLSNESKVFGYNYASEIIQRVITTDLRNSVLDGVLINGKTLREIIANETAYVALENYPVRVDLDKDCLIIYIQEDSAIYADVNDGMTVELASTLTFENDNGIAANSVYKLKDGNFESFRYIKSITVKTNKNQYYKGQDLDLSKFNAYGVYNNDEKGDNFTVTADMISGYDKNKVGKQIVTITYEGCTAQVEITVLESEQGDNGSSGGNTGNTSKGCGANVLENGTPVFMAFLLGMAYIVVKLIRKKNNGKN